MKKFLIFVAVVVAAFFIYKIFFKKNKPPREKPIPVSVSKHSDAFNKSVGEVLNAYYAMNNGFVNWDPAVVTKEAENLDIALKALKTDDLKKDSTIYQTILYPYDLAKTNTAGILNSADWTERRRALNDLSDNLRMILLTVKYDQAKTYWNECPMAFGEGQAANWLSSKEEVVNPYLGSKDPKYGNSMLNCGETKATIDFMLKDSTVAK